MNLYVLNNKILKTAYKIHHILTIVLEGDSEVDHEKNGGQTVRGTHNYRINAVNRYP